MPNNVSFFGFPTGDQVTIDSVTVPAWGMSPTTPVTSIFDVTATAGTSVTISVERSPFQTAPEALKFDLSMAGFDTNTPATASQYDVTYADKQVFWRCRTNYNFTAPTQVLALDAADGGNRAAAGFGIGRLWEYVAQTPGECTFDVVVYEPSSGKIGKATRIVRVADPAVEFPTTQTIFVDTTGLYTNAPPGAQRRTSIGAALSLMEGQGTTKHRVMLERDQTHIMSSPVTVQAGSGATISNFRIEAREGAGAAPIVVDNTGQTNDRSIFFENANRNAQVTAEFCLSGVEFVGDHDPTDGSGRQANFLDVNIRQFSGDYILVNNCIIRGFARAVTVSESTGGHPTRRITLCNNIITDWAHYGFFGGNQSQLAFLGNRIAQNVDAIFNLDASSPASLARSSGSVNGGWCVRVASATRLVVRANDSFANQGWSGGYGATFRAGQAAWRIMANGIPAWSRICITHNTFEGARFAAYLRPSDTSSPRNPTNALIEGNFMIGGFQGSEVFELAMGGTTFRNNQMVSAGDKTASADGGTNISPIAGIRYRNGGPDQNGNATIPVSIDSNSIINHATSAMRSKVSDADITLNVSETGNLFHEPNTTFADTGDAPFVVTPAITPRFKGFRNNAGTLFATYATPLGAGDIYTKANGTGANTKPDYSAP